MTGRAILAMDRLEKPGRRTSLFHLWSHAARCNQPGSRINRPTQISLANRDAARRRQLAGELNRPSGERIDTAGDRRIVKPQSQFL
jgi:hypothetical protein